jgi:hypothetical protein
MIRLAIGIALWGSTVASAAPPSTVQFQTRLTDASGSPIAGARDVVVRLYDSPTGTTALWTETHPQVSIGDGYASLALGSITPFPSTSWADGPRWIGVTVNGVELAPRTQVLAVPFAQTASQVPSASAPPVTCDASAAGRVYHDSALQQIRACNGVFWTGLGESGAYGTQAQPATSCKHLNVQRPSLGSGTYWLDPDGSATGFAPFEAWCDMTVGNAGWTLCANFIDTAGNDIVNSLGSFDWTTKEAVTGGAWLTGATTAKTLSQSGAIGCAAFGAASGATEMRFSCAGGSTSFDSGGLAYNASAFSASGPTVGGLVFTGHGEWYWGGYGARSWVATTRSSGYANCSSNSCNANGMGWDDGPTRMEIIGGGGDGCSNGCSNGDIWYSGGDEGANCNGTNMRGTNDDRYSAWVR